MSIVKEALLFATQKHLHQHRKGTRIPYMAHLLNVCKILAERVSKDEVLAGALLHDVVEDTEVTIEEVEVQFGEMVAEIVKGATELDKLNKLDQDKQVSWRHRKQHTIEFIRNAATIDQLLVVAADKLDNIRSLRDDWERLGDDVWNRFNAPKEDQMWYYQMLSEAIQMRQSESPILTDLSALLDTAVRKVFY